MIPSLPTFAPVAPVPQRDGAPESTSDDDAQTFLSQLNADDGEDTLGGDLTFSEEKKPEDDDLHILLKETATDIDAVDPQVPIDKADPKTKAVPFDDQGKPGHNIGDTPRDAKNGDAIPVTGVAVPRRQDDTAVQRIQPPKDGGASLPVRPGDAAKQNRLLPEDLGPKPRSIPAAPETQKSPVPLVQSGTAQSPAPSKDSAPSIKGADLLTDGQKPDAGSRQAVQATPSQPAPVSPVPAAKPIAATQQISQSDNVKAAVARFAPPQDGTQPQASWKEHDVRRSEALWHARSPAETAYKLTPRLPTADPTTAAPVVSGQTTSVLHNDPRFGVGAETSDIALRNEIGSIQTDRTQHVAPQTAPPAADQTRQIAQQLAAGMPSRTPGTSEILLQPEELGRVRMSLTLQDGVMAVAIQAERPETLDLMRRHIDQLAQTYRDMGFENMSFSFSGSAQQNQGEFSEQADLNVASGESDTSPRPTPHLPATDGRLDLRM